MTDKKDSFHTFAYKGGFVHTCWNRTKQCEEVTVQRYEGDKARRVPSVKGAKMRISKYKPKED